MYGGPRVTRRRNTRERARTKKMEKKKERKTGQPRTSKTKEAARQGCVRPFLAILPVYVAEEAGRLGLLVWPVPSDRIFQRLPAPRTCPPPVPIPATGLSTGRAVRLLFLAARFLTTVREKETRGRRNSCPVGLRTSPRCVD